MKLIAIGIAILAAACGPSRPHPPAPTTTTVSIPERTQPERFIVCTTPDGYVYTTSPLTGCAAK